jgi:pyruvate/2-oxoglutarate dehydrogenase complex dihydrolipoamide acyltransferase (E2) component
VVVADGETVTVGLTLALADADGEGVAEADAEGEAEAEGNGVGFGVAVFVGVGVGVGFGAAVTVNVAETECETFLSTKLARTVWPPAPRWPLGGVNPNRVAVQVDVPTNLAVPSDTTPSHENDALVVGHFPCEIVYVTRALNDCVPDPLFGVSVRERAANAGSDPARTTQMNRVEPMSARRFIRGLPS